MKKILFTAAIISCFISIPVIQAQTDSQKSEFKCHESNVCEQYEDNKYSFGFYHNDYQDKTAKHCTIVTKQYLINRILKSIQNDKELINLHKQKGLYGSMYNYIADPDREKSMNLLYNELNNGSITNGAQYRNKCSQKAQDYISTLISLESSVRGTFKNNDIKYITFLPDGNINIDQYINSKLIKREHKAKDNLKSLTAWYNPDYQTNDGKVCLSKLEQYDNNGYPNTWNYFENCKRIRTEIDTKKNGQYDGKPDVWFYFDPLSENEKKSSIIKKAIDHNLDGTADQWIYYDPAKGNENNSCFIKIESDTNYNGIIDTWEYYENCKLVRTEYDQNENGTKETVYLYQPGESNWYKSIRLGFDERKKADEIFNNKNYSESISWFKKSIAEYRKEYGTNDIPSEEDNRWWERDAVNAISMNYKNIGDCYLKLNNAPEAKRYYSIASNIGSKYQRGTVNFDIGKILVSIKFNSEAKDYFKRSIDIDNTYSSAYLNYADCLFYEKDLKGAIENVKKALQLNPNDINNLYSIGVYLWLNNEINESKQYLLKVINANLQIFKENKEKLVKNFNEIESNYSEKKSSIKKLKKYILNLISK